ncbi:MAG: DUF2284 domain-containing protein [Candidatus Thermoplasmatota archaeon]
MSEGEKDDHYSPNGIPSIYFSLRWFFMTSFKGLGAGPCYLCDECELEEGCVHPHRARPAMEACRIDVYKTVRETGFPVEVVENGDCSQNYYGLLLLE